MKIRTACVFCQKLIQADVPDQERRTNPITGHLVVLIACQVCGRRFDYDLSVPGTPPPPSETESLRSGSTGLFRLSGESSPVGRQSASAGLGWEERREPGRSEPARISEPPFRPVFLDSSSDAAPAPAHPPTPPPARSHPESPRAKPRRQTSRGPSLSLNKRYEALPAWKQYLILAFLILVIGVVIFALPIGEPATPP